ncbi:uncharacterized protein LOC131253653 isoform X4 [Magnolia sinica]|uniref:uncharacterized protein LOC131253653 isoform X4 n=1 Tax=Magnolia sinica TaxID=86752 RepID=UPI0026592165|nr:uncharacterized protein LOC131253653 isoform X4 [Magnolia sinica]
MEEEKRRKKNKKKRGKQSKVTDVAFANGETAPAQNHHAQNSDNACIQNAGVSESDVEVNSHKTDDSRSVVLEEEIRQLEAEKHSWIRREKCLEEDINQVMLDKHSWILKEASLEEKIRLLQVEKDSCMQKEVNLEEKIRQLQDERDSWLQMEASLEEKIKHLESGNDSWVLKENSNKEMIARLNKVNIGLQAQVKELEESRNSLLQENQQLVESASFLEARIQYLERDVSFPASTAETTKQDPKDEDASSLVEAASAMVEKLVAENAELVEKVNELYIELDRRGGTVDRSSTTAGFNPAQLTSETTFAPDSLLQYSEKMPASIGRVESPASVQTVDGSIVVDNAELESTAGTSTWKEGLLEPPEISEISEIVQIPLEENEIHEVEVESPRAAEVGDDAAVPLTDAPLIGAPFRLISFMARYVSGADLVNNKNSSGSEQ